MEVRKFHNSIKKSMLSEYSKKVRTGKKQSVHLLDLGCGRGGDLHKWINAKIDRVIGLDADHEAIAEANERLSAIKKGSNTSIEFICLDVLAQNTPHDLVTELKRIYGSTSWFQFDLVSMHFSLQYFVDNPTELLRILKFIAERMSPGGYFYGTSPRKDKILELLASSDSYESDILKINTTRDSAILFDVDLGRNSYFDKFGTSEEYLVNMDHFAAHCSSVGLELVRIQNFEELSSLPPGPEKEFSDLYCTWAFRKPEQFSFFPLVGRVRLSKLEIDRQHIPMVSKPHEAQRIQNSIRVFFSKRDVPRNSLSLIDMCACVGCDTIHFSPNFKSVLAIEKDSSTFKKLENNVKQYGLKNVHLLNENSTNYLHLYSDPQTVLYFDPPWLSVDNRSITLNGEPFGQMINNILKQFNYKFIVAKLPRAYPIQADHVASITKKISLFFFVKE